MNLQIDAAPPKGVAFTEPPEHLIPDIMGSINRAVAQLPPDANGALVAVADRSGVNAAVVAKIDESWRVTAWIGKSWGGPVEAGALVMKTW